MFIYQLKTVTTIHKHIRQEKPIQKLINKHIKYMKKKMLNNIKSHNSYTCTTKTKKKNSKKPEKYKGWKMQRNK